MKYGFISNEDQLCYDCNMVTQSYDQFKQIQAQAQSQSQSPTQSQSNIKSKSKSDDQLDSVHAPRWD